MPKPRESRGWTAPEVAQAKERMREGGGDRKSEDYEKSGHVNSRDPIPKGKPHEWTDERLGREAGREGGLSKGQVNSLEASKVDNQGWTNVRIAKEAGQ